MKFSIGTPHGNISVDDTSFTLDDYDNALELLFPDVDFGAAEDLDGLTEVDAPVPTFNVGDMVRIVSDVAYGLEGYEGEVVEAEVGDKGVLYTVELNSANSDEPLFYYHGEELELILAADAVIPPASILEDAIEVGSTVKVVRSDRGDSGRVFGLTGRVIQFNDPEQNETGTSRVYVDFMDDPVWTPETTAHQCYFWVDVSALELVNDYSVN